MGIPNMHASAEIYKNNYLLHLRSKLPCKGLNMFTYLPNMPANTNSNREANSSQTQCKSCLSFSENILE